MFLPLETDELGTVTDMQHCIETGSNYPSSEITSGSSPFRRETTHD